MSTIAVLACLRCSTVLIMKAFKWCQTIPAGFVSVFHELGQEGTFSTIAVLWFGAWVQSVIRLHIKCCPEYKGSQCGEWSICGQFITFGSSENKGFLSIRSYLGYVRTPYYQCYWPKVKATCQIRKPKGWSEEGGRGQQTIPGLIGTNTCKWT